MRHGQIIKVELIEETKSKIRVMVTTYFNRPSMEQLLPIVNHFLSRFNIRSFSVAFIGSCGTEDPAHNGTLITFNRMLYSGYDVRTEKPTGA